MPDYPGINDLLLRPDSFRQKKVGKIGQVDAFGGKHYARINTYGGNDITRTELDALRNAVGRASNAGVFEDGIEDYHEISVVDAQAINDTLGLVSSVAVFHFQRSDNAQLKEKFEVAAPKREMLVKAGNKWFVDEESTMADDIIQGCLAAYNAAIPDGEPNYVFVRASMSDRKRGSLGGKEVPNVIDPVV